MKYFVLSEVVIHAAFTKTEFDNKEHYITLRLQKDVS